MEDKLTEIVVSIFMFKHHPALIIDCCMLNEVPAFCHPSASPVFRSSVLLSGSPVDFSFHFCWQLHPSTFALEVCANKAN
jgi:hypothetical protein